MAMAAGGSRANINVTPLIDVLLVLLIIFMVITPLTPRGLEALLPESASIQRAPDLHTFDPAIVIEVSQDHSYRINGQATREPELTARLVDIFKTRFNKVVFVKGDPDVDYRYVAAAIDDAKGAGLENIGLLTAQMQGKN